MSGERHTFVFADLAGFTVLTEAHGDERAADVNIAARVAALAGPSEVLLTAATRDAAGTRGAVVFEDCRTHERFFCSALCAGKFARSPVRYLRDAAPVSL